METYIFEYKNNVMFSYSTNDDYNNYHKYEVKKEEDDEVKGNLVCILL